MSQSYDQLLGAEQRAWNRDALRLAAVLAVILVCACYVGLFDGARRGEGGTSLFSMLGEMLPPNFNDWRNWIKPLLDTLAMSVAGTALAVAFSLPVAFLAARNTTPHPAVYQAARGMLNALRSVPELILGIIFVAAVGLVPCLVCWRSACTRLAWSASSRRGHRAQTTRRSRRRAAGGTPLQVILHGVLPQVLPQMADISIYRWEYASAPRP